jgi:O-antigen ligase
MVRKTTRDLVLLCIAITYILTGNMLSVFSTGFPFRDYLRLILAAWGIITFFRTIDVRRVAIRNILTPLLFLIFLIIPTTVMFYGLKTNFTWTVLQVGDALAWIGVFSIAYRVGLQYPGMIKKAAPVLACSIAIYAALFTQVKLFSAGRGIPLISTAYYTLFFLPFALLSEKKVIKWGGTVLVLYTLLLCMKRTGFIAFVAGIVVYILVEYRSAPKGSKKRAFVLIGGLLALTAMYFFIMENTKGTFSVIDRLLSTGQTSNEGREDVWPVVISMIRHSDIIALIFGHGFDTVIENSPLALSAHCDFLEVIYDYGVSGLLLYLTFYKRLWNGFIKMYRHGSELAAPMSFTFVTAFVVSLFSHLIIFPTYFLGFCLFWGLAMGSVDSEEANSLRY